MWGFIRFYVGSPVLAVLGAIAVIYGYISDGYQLWTAGLPSQVWQAAGAIIFFLAVGFMLYRHHQRMEVTHKQPPSGPQVMPLEIIKERDYTGQTVVLDGKHLIGCKFSNTTLQYNGGRYDLTKCHLDRQPDRIISVAFGKPEMVAAYQLLVALGFVRPDAHHHIIKDPNATQKD